MANEHVEINGTATRLNSELRRLVDATQATKDDVVSFKLMIDQIGSDADVATALGISESDANKVKSLLTNVYVVMVGGDIGYFLSRLG